MVKLMKYSERQDKIMQTDLLTIPGVGKSMKQHLENLGITCVADLIGQDPEALYLKDCQFHGGHVDRCVLYVYRLAVYFAENETHEPEKLKWWNWKD
jgi:hypothetical protein